MGEPSLTEANWQKPNGQTDARGRTLQPIELTTPSNYGTSNDVTLNDSQLTNFAAGYINFYTCNGVITIPKFNDHSADDYAFKTVQAYAGSRDIVQVDITGIASGGGGIHCVRDARVARVTTAAALV
ncbi:MAG: Agmatine deiminase (EC [uncultured Paraburkholderia sp.]|nr:MAG: Agmatine deiminase (EC [uncultured Paraburkholderia sp.]CAH2940595.1 MAG: Agmatine deiminase (EC [uncultured Paraburkholderia sp.]